MTLEDRPIVESIINKQIGALPRPYPELAPSILDLFYLTNKSAVVTGGLRGIGYCISEAYCQADVAKLAIIDYADNEVTLSQLQKTYPKTEIIYLNCDVRKADQVRDVINKIDGIFGGIDIFVANAGIAWTSGPMIDVETDDDWHNVINIDLNGVYYCAKHVGRIFKRQGHGSLIMTASMSAHIVNVPQLQASYNAAKAAVLHLGKSLAVEWAPFARVNTVSPGYIATELSDFVPEDVKGIWYGLTPLGRQGLPRELTGAYLYFASDASTFATGSDLRVDGGYCAP